MLLVTSSTSPRRKSSFGRSRKDLSNGANSVHARAERLSRNHPKVSTRKRVCKDSNNFRRRSSGRETLWPEPNPSRQQQEDPRIVLCDVLGSIFVHLAQEKEIGLSSLRLSFYWIYSAFCVLFSWPLVGSLSLFFYYSTLYSSRLRVAYRVDDSFTNCFV